MNNEIRNKEEILNFVKNFDKLKESNKIYSVQGKESSFKNTNHIIFDECVYKNDDNNILFKRKIMVSDGIVIQNEESLTLSIDDIKYIGISPICVTPLSFEEHREL